MKDQDCCPEGCCPAGCCGARNPVMPGRSGIVIGPGIARPGCAGRLPVVVGLRFRDAPRTVGPGP